MKESRLSEEQIARVLRQLEDESQRSGAWWRISRGTSIGCWRYSERKAEADAPPGAGRLVPEGLGVSVVQP